MSFKYEWKKQPTKFVKSQTREQQTRIMAAVGKLPWAGDIRQIEGRKGVYGLRVGCYRVVYSVDKDRLLITVIEADVRGQVYKNL